MSLLLMLAAGLFPLVWPASGFSQAQATNSAGPAVWSVGLRSGAGPALVVSPRLHTIDPLSPHLLLDIQRTLTIDWSLIFSLSWSSYDHETGPRLRDQPGPPPAYFNRSVVAASVGVTRWVQERFFAGAGVGFALVGNNSMRGLTGRGVRLDHRAGVALVECALLGTRQRMVAEIRGSFDIFENAVRLSQAAMLGVEISQ